VKDANPFTTIKSTGKVTRSTAMTVNLVNVTVMLTAVCMMLTLTFSLIAMTLVEEVYVKDVNTIPQVSSVRPV
jgi:hypothetical protein